MSCGIFAYVGQEKIKLRTIYNCLKDLESLQEAEDTSPLGGHGAGYVMLSDALVPFYNKVGYFEKMSAVDALFDLDELKEVEESSFFIAHVRRASDEFSNAEELDELHAQPFVHSGAHYRVYGVHNGFLKNYIDLKGKFSLSECFTDSDALCQVFLALLERYDELSRACEELFSIVDGNNTAVFLVEKREQFWLVVMHTGKTRGIVIYENELGEIIISSRKSVLEKHFAGLLERKKFFETLFIKPKEHQIFINWWRVEINPPFKLSEY